MTLSAVNHFHLGSWRYPTDPYDRYWFPGTDPKWTSKSTPSIIQPDPSYGVPLAILQTSAAAAGNDTTLNFTWKAYKKGDSFMAFLYFADFQNNQTRQFDIYFNGNQLGLP